MSPRNRTLLVGGIAAVALLVVLFVVLRPADDKPATTTTAPTTTTTTVPTTTAAEPTTTTGPEAVVFEIVVFDGKPVDGIQRFSAAKGDTVRIEVSRAPGEEIHVHGYDETLELGADGTGTITFEATLQGVFEVELERAGIQVAELTVS